VKPGAVVAVACWLTLVGWVAWNLWKIREARRELRAQETQESILIDRQVARLAGFARTLDQIERLPVADPWTVAE
jgi:hypothetical protein